MTPAVASDGEVVAHYHTTVTALADMGLGLARARGWKPGSSTVEEEGIELLKTALPLVIGELRTQGLLPEGT